MEESEVKTLNVSEIRNLKKTLNATYKKIGIKCPKPLHDSLQPDIGEWKKINSIIEKKIDDYVRINGSLVGPDEALCMNLNEGILVIETDDDFLVYWS
ncbi:MAG: hypothetical protein ACXADW_21670 [Candidatus Hodarchaeales archaeon]|jgi:hypothetical protein